MPYRTPEARNAADRARREKRRQTNRAALPDKSTPETPAKTMSDFIRIRNIVEQDDDIYQLSIFACGIELEKVRYDSARGHISPWGKKTGDNANQIWRPGRICRGYGELYRRLIIDAIEAKFSVKLPRQFDRRKPERAISELLQELWDDHGQPGKYAAFFDAVADTEVEGEVARQWLLDNNHARLAPAVKPEAVVETPPKPVAKQKTTPSKPLPLITGQRWAT
jgi:hypothetical protein